MPSESILKDALTAYLQPLLKKHEANALVEFEDLTASWKAADAVLKRSSAADDAVKQVSDLHKSQLQAYQKAAKEALSSWATNDFVLPTRQAKEVADTYSYRCVEAATVQRPLWKVPATALENCLIKVVQHRAAAQTEETVEEGEELDEDTDTIDAKEDDDEVGEEEGEEDEEEEGEVEEDEMGEDDGEAIVETPTGEESDKVNEAAMKAALTNRKRVLLAKKKGQADGKAKQAPKKKIVLAKVGASTASSGTKQGARRKNAPRRGGRSGGRAKGNS